MTNRKLLIIIAIILLCAIIAGAAIWLLRPAGSRVVVTVSGEEFGTYDLHEDQTIQIIAKDGSWYNILRIEDGTAAVIESDCNNQICVNTPALSEDTIGIIVCLPHGVAVELK